MPASNDNGSQDPSRQKFKCMKRSLLFHQPCSSAASCILACRCQKRCSKTSAFIKSFSEHPSVTPNIQLLSLIHKTFREHTPTPVISLISCLASRKNPYQQNLHNRHWVFVPTLEFQPLGVISAVNPFLTPVLPCTQGLDIWLCDC